MNPVLTSQVGYNGTVVQLCIEAILFFFGLPTRNFFPTGQGIYGNIGELKKKTLCFSVYRTVHFQRPIVLMRMSLKSLLCIMGRRA